MKSNPLKTISIISSIALVATLLVIISTQWLKGEKEDNEISEAIQEESQPKGAEKDTMPEDHIAYHFDYPVGPPISEGYYNAQEFAENNHLGDDWNGTGGGNTDLGDPIFAIANGKVKVAEDYGGGWGKIVRLIHQLPNGEVVESFYAHCETMLVKKGDWVKRGDQIATIGNADGAYLAHLHFEIRTDTSMGNGGGYSPDTQGYVDPTAFIEAHR